MFKKYVKWNSDSCSKLIGCEPVIRVENDKVVLAFPKVTNVEKFITYLLIVAAFNIVEKAVIEVMKEEKGL